MNPILMHLLGAATSNSGNEAVLDRIPVPAGKVVEVLQLLDDTEEPTELEGPIQQSWKRCAALHSIIPALRGRRFRLNTQCITTPIFEITGDFKKPTPNRLIKQVFEVPRSEIRSVVNRIDQLALNATLMARYGLWAYLQEIFPDMDLSLESMIKIELEAGEWLCVVQYHKDGL